MHGEPELRDASRTFIEQHESEGIGLSVISCWEVAKLVERGRLSLPVPLGRWMDLALAYPGVRLLDLTPQIVVESTSLPGPFHRDPGDQILVATARVHNVPLVTADKLILGYPHVRTVSAR